MLFNGRLSGGCSPSQYHLADVVCMKFVVAGLVLLGRGPVRPGKVFESSRYFDTMPSKPRCFKECVMDYQQAENQIAQVQQQSQLVLQKLQAFGQKLATSAPDAQLAREWAMDLREVALNLQSQTQNANMLIAQMVQYIQRLEADVSTHPNPTVQPTGWANANTGGSNFMSSLTTGLGMGAGFAVADDLVGDLFNLF